MNGTRYYTTGDSFLFFVSRLLRTAPYDYHLQTSLHPLLNQRIQEQIGLPGDALSLAMRLQVCHAFAIENELDLQTLLGLQQTDGGWEIGYMYKYGSTGVKIGNRGLTTAFAVKAIALFQG